MENVTSVWSFQGVVLRRGVKFTFNLYPRAEFVLGNKICLHNKKHSRFRPEKA
jgi:hypothetical protein